MPWGPTPICLPPPPQPPASCLLLPPHLLRADERHRGVKGAMCKAQVAAANLAARHRLLLTPAAAAGGGAVDELLLRAAFLHPQYQSLDDLPGGGGGSAGLTEAQQVGKADRRQAGGQQSEAGASQLLLLCFSCTAPLLCSPQLTPHPPPRPRPPHMLVERLRALLDPLTLRRPRALLPTRVLPAAEVRLGVAPTPAQAAAARTAMARAYELLTDPRPSRYSGYRAAQLRGVLAEVRRALHHPSLAGGEGSAGGGEDGRQAAGQGQQQPAAAGADAGAELASLLAGSAKLALLDALLRQLHAQGRRVMVTAHSGAALGLLQRAVGARFGPSAALRLDAEAPTATRAAAVAAFSDPGGPAWVFLAHGRALGLGTDLPGVDAVVAFDSDWSARADAQVGGGVGGAGGVGPLRLSWGGQLPWPPGLTQGPQGRCHDRVSSLGSGSLSLSGAPWGLRWWGCPGCCCCCRCC